MKKSKFIIEIALVVQSLTCFLLFIHYINKRRDLSRTFFALGLIGGLASLYAFYCDFKEQKEFDELAHDYCYGDDSDCFGDDASEYFNNFEDNDADDINVVLPDDDSDDSAGDSGNSDK